MTLFEQGCDILVPRCKSFDQPFEKVKHANETGGGDVHCTKYCAPWSRWPFPTFMSRVNRCSIRAGLRLQK